jgi:hypothetical protein
MTATMKPDPQHEPDEPFEETKPGETAGAAFGAPLGAIAGGIAGSVAGLGGIVAGAIGGAAAGAALGHAVGAGGYADDEHWKEALRQQPYFDPAYDFDDYATAFRLGREGRHAFGDRDFDEIEPRLHEDWERVKGGSRLQWEQAREAVRGAWERAAASP